MSAYFLPKQWLKTALMSSLALALLGVLGVFIYGHFIDDTQAYTKASTQLANVSSEPSSAGDNDLIKRGAYLARIGNCAGCHTNRGGAAYAGGRVLKTAFGQFVVPNITPDLKAGIGTWSAEDFWQALHNGRGKGGRFLYPVFPYTNYAQVTREDADAMYAFLRTITPSNAGNAEHQLRFPYNQRQLLALWRGLYFRPAVFTADSKQSVMWNRGAYLVRGLTHCGACHSSRNVLGAVRDDSALDGAYLPAIEWYAPSLTAENETPLQRWNAEELHALLQHGQSPNAVASGPMAEVVSTSLQYLHRDDVVAMSSYLQSLPIVPMNVPDAFDRFLVADKLGPRQLELLIAQGQKVYEDNCATCHGKNGEGVVNIYPRLQNNSNVMMSNPVNTIRLVLTGGFPVATQGNPRPYGMPPFGPSLNDAEIAALLTYVRRSWGNQGEAISSSEVNRYRTAPMD